MPPRSGDSTPKFDQIEANLADAVNPPHTPSPLDDDQSLPDSHVFQMPMAIPHFSDGTTEVLKRGRDDEETIVQDPTEPLFPQSLQPAPPPPVVASEPEHDPEATLPAGFPIAPPVEVVAPAISVASVSKAGRASVKPPPQPAAASASPPAAPRAGSSLLTILLISYASAVTLGLLYLLFNRDGAGAADPHQLESLRDPVDEEGTVRIYQRGVELPPGHDLKLAQSQRFGNILVEPLRITRGPITFTHYSGNSKLKQPPSAPVFKLWLKFTNVSADQQIAPVDSLLVFKRELNREGDLVSNTYLAPKGQASDGPIVFAYPVAQSSEWDLVGQRLGHPLGPGESIETFIPSDAEGLEGLTGELEWRFHLRKGYAPTKRGVTTLVQVHFNASQVETEPPLPTEPASTGKKKA